MMSLSNLPSFFTRSWVILVLGASIAYPGTAASSQHSDSLVTTASGNTVSIKTALIDDAPWRTRANNEQVTRTLFPVNPELGLSRSIRQIANVVAKKEVRLLTIAGRNDIVNLNDLLFLRGVDSAVIRSDAIEYVKRQNEFPGITRVVNTLARLYEQKLVILANPTIRSIEQLNGRRIASGIKGSGEYVTASLILDMFDIEDITQLELSTDAAILQLQNGEIDALFHLMPPHALSPQLKESGQQLINLTGTDQFSVLPLVLNDESAQVYTKAKLTADDLPGLIEKDQEIPALAVQVIMAGYRWNPRHARYTMASRFAEAFMDGAATLQDGEYADYWAGLDFEFAVPGVQQLNTVRSVFANREARTRAAQYLEEARRQAQIDAQRKVLEYKRVEIETMISQLVDNAAEADIGKLQEISDQLDAIVTELGSLADVN